MRHARSRGSHALNFDTLRMPLSVLDVQYFSATLAAVIRKAKSEGAYQASWQTRHFKQWGGRAALILHVPGRSQQTKLSGKRGAPC